MELSREQQLERRLWRHFNKGITQYGLLNDGDHILLGLSGGKDSLALLEFMAKRAKIYRPKIKLTALHVRIYARFCSRRAAPAQAGEQYRCRPSGRKVLPHTGQGRVSVMRSTVSDLSSTGSRGSTAERK